jgi:flagella basal body P-ring formation protein FlgA
MAAVIRTLTFVVLLGAAAPAAAQVATTRLPAVATLKSAVTVSSDVVRIKDIVENAGPVGNAPIFRSPDVGTTGSVSVESVLTALRAHHLYLIDTGALTAVEVTRDGRRIDLKDFEARIALTFAGKYGLGDVSNLVVTLDPASRPITIDPSASSDLQVQRATLDARSGRFDITFEAPTSAAMRQAPLRYTGRIVEMIDAVLLTHTIARGDLLKASDLAVERRPKAEITGDVVVSVDEAIGMTVRNPLRAGQPIRRADLVKPEMIRRDEAVTLIYEAPGILLTTRGKALESGGEGDVINVLNVQSKRTVQGAISGPGRVTIAATTTRPLLAAGRQSLASRLPPE